MYELKKIGKVFASKFVGTGLSSYEKRIYRTAVSQKLRNTNLKNLHDDHTVFLCLVLVYQSPQNVFLISVNILRFALEKEFIVADVGTHLFLSEFILHRVENITPRTKFITWTQWWWYRIYPTKCFISEATDQIFIYVLYCWSIKRFPEAV
jgi:hypothetical protein